MKHGKGQVLIEEIVIQSRVEFNVEADEQDVLAFGKAKINATQHPPT